MNIPVVMTDAAARNRERVRRYQKNNYEKILARNRAYAESNPNFRLVSRAKSRAKKFGHEFSITTADFSIPEFCPVLGILLSKGPGKRTDYSPSLDRIDNSKGYTPDNIWVISDRANRIKNDSTLSDLRLLVAALEARQAGMEPPSFTDPQAALPKP